MVSDLLIRPMMAADADSVGRIGFDAWASNPALNSLGDTVAERIRASFHAFCGNNVPVITVVERQGEILGWSAREDDPDHISDLWIAPFCQGQGIGTALLTHMLAVISDEGHPLARIAAQAQNLGAIRLYQRHGFVMVWKGLEWSEPLALEIEAVHLERAYIRL